MHILLDLDRTLIDTSSVEEHMRDSRGRDYVANNITRFLTDPYHEDLAKLLNKMANDRNLAMNSGRMKTLTELVKILFLMITKMKI